MMRQKLMAATLVVGAVLVALMRPAGACGGLIGENGTVQLVRTTTLAAYSDGVEHYITGFEFTGEGESVGSIIPLPGEPTEVVKAGDWTLQRLVQEVTPEPEGDRGAEVASAQEDSEAEVILETEVDALDITVLRGGGDEVGEWAVDNGFLLTPDAPEVLDFYGDRSPYFMAAKFDAQRAADLGQGAGDSTPVMATIPTDRPWVPLRFLGMGLDGAQQVEADVFMLTDERPDLMAGGDGIRVERSEPANDQLLDDLRSDQRMEWVPDEAWLTYMVVDSDAGGLDYDLAASTTAGVEPTYEDAGIAAPTAAVPLDSDGDDGLPMWPLAAAAGAVVLVVGVAWQRTRRSAAAAGGPPVPPGTPGLS